MDKPASRPADAFWEQPLARSTAELACGVDGLSSTDAAQRLARFGPNVLGDSGRPPAWLEFLARLRSPLVLLLLAACIGSALVGDGTSAVVIVVIVLGSVMLDFVQERRAGDAARRLRDSVGLTAVVSRDGRECRIPAVQVVPGDVVLLAAGDLVPADGRILEARDFFVRQSVLTGESWPVEKHAGEAASRDGELASATNAAFMGSSVLSGSARVLVCRTGGGSFLGDVAATLRQAPPPTAFERGTRGFGEMVVRLTAVLVLFVVFVNLMAHRPVAETFLFAIALAVGLTPELLPMIVSVTLSRGAMRMARREVVVKRLAAIQNLGSMDVLCTDKTGTLTEARVRLQQHVDADGRESARVLELAWINSHFESGLRSPLDEAILAAPGDGADGWRKLDELPFGFERRRVAVLAQREGRHLLVVKGAPEDVLAACTSIERAGVVSALDAAGHAEVKERFEAMGPGRHARARGRVAGDAGGPPAGLRGRRVRARVLRPRRLPRSSQGRRGRSPGAPACAARAGEGRDGRQRGRGAPRLRPGRAAGEAPADGRAGRGAGRSRAGRPGQAHRRVLPGVAGAEMQDPARAAQPWARGRFPGGRCQ